LTRGRGRFNVAPRPQRNFQVRAGEVTITVVGTVFTVERIADRVGVTVERGSVRVGWGLGSRLLEKGESGWFPPLLVDSPGESPSAPPTAPKPVRGKSPPASRSSPVSAPATPSTSAEELLLAADSARMAGHPGQGAELLRRLLREHRTDPRAPLAAFTLGRVLLMELGKPREAAAAFAEVRQLAPQGSFAEDALAREVEAWSQARQLELARARAQEYLRYYPGGRRAATVRAMGGLE
jgi:transmembrane sensor